MIRRSVLASSVTSSSLSSSSSPLFFSTASVVTSALLRQQRRSQVSISGDEAPPSPASGRYSGGGAAAAGELQPQMKPQSTVTATTRTGEVITLIDNTDEVVAANRNFIESHRRAKEEEAELQAPIHPDQLQPAFVKVARSAKLVRFKADETADDLVRIDHYPGLPPMTEHPWIPGQPIGDFADIVHGDGQIGVVGTGEVGFDNERREYPRQWRGLRPRFLAGMRIPQSNGIVSESLVVKYSLDRTGRGVFATKDIKKGELMMCVRSSAVSLGYVPRIERLIEMMRDVLLRVYDAVKEEEREWLANGGRFAAGADGKPRLRGHAEMERLHTWILQGQQSSLVEQWSAEHTEKLIRKIGGREVLDTLEMHPLHIARLAAVLDMNSFIVEGFYNDDRGRGYWPEAGLLNHSCCPNADYEIMDEEHFKISDFNPEFVAARDKYEREMEAQMMMEKKAHQQQQPQQSSADAATTPEEKKEEDLNAALRQGLAENVVVGSSGSNEAASGAGGAAEAQTDSNGGEETLMRKMERQAEGEAQKSNAAKRQVALYEDDADQQQQQQASGKIGHEYYDPSGSYLFVCRAAKDIAAGEEVLIAYVPPEWRYDNRQHVLYERYKFWCRCEKCAPSVESFTKLYPRAAFFMVIFFIFLQTAAYQAREHSLLAQENMDRGHLFPAAHFYSLKEGDLPDMKHDDVLVHKSAHPQQYPVPQERKASQQQQ